MQTIPMCWPPLPAWFFDGSGKCLNSPWRFSTVLVAKRLLIKIAGVVLLVCVVVASWSESFYQLVRRVLGGGYHTCWLHQEASNDQIREILGSHKHFVILFHDPVFQSLDFFSPGNTVAVADSSKPGLMKALSATKLSALTCGLSPRDTITLSSITPDSAVINVQRTIPSFGGHSTEPQEIPVKMEEPVDSFALMAIAAVALLDGKIELLLQSPFFQGQPGTAILP